MLVLYSYHAILISILRLARWGMHAFINTETHTWTWQALINEIRVWTIFLCAICYIKLCTRKIHSEKKLGNFPLKTPCKKCPSSWNSPTTRKHPHLKQGCLIQKFLLNSDQAVSAWNRHALFNLRYSFTRCWFEATCMIFCDGTSSSFLGFHWLWQ